MTATAEEHAAAAEAKPIPIEGAVDVRIIHGSALFHEEAADFGAFFSVVLAGTEAPVQLLPYDVNRKRATVTCTGTGPVYIGSLSGVTQAKAGAVTGQAPAFILPTGITVTITGKQAVYLAPDGTHTATVSVVAERWES